MAVLPAGGNLADGIQFAQYPDLTWNIDKDSNRITGTASGLQAVQQAIGIILNTERFRWQIYRPYSGMQWDGLIGEDTGYVASELQRRISDALLMDDRVRSVADFACRVEGDSLTVSLTVDTVYGEVQTQMEVNLS